MDTSILTEVEQIVALYAPSIVSIISMIATIVVAIKKFKNSADETKTEVKSMRNALINTDAANAKLMKENAELKQEIKELKTDIVEMVYSNKTVSQTLEKAVEAMNTTNKDLAVLKKQNAKGSKSCHQNSLK